MEYNGFISTLIKRIEQLLPADEKDDLQLLPADGKDDLQVTRMLLMLNTGFALVWDRIQYWEDPDDVGLRRENPWPAFKTARKKNSKHRSNLTIRKYLKAFEPAGAFRISRSRKMMLARS